MSTARAVTLSVRVPCAQDVMSQRVLVTGSGGFVGPHVVWALRRAGAEVFELRNREDCDLSNLKAAEQRLAVVQPEIVIHLAASPDHARFQPADAYNTLASTTSILHALERLGTDCRIVHAGSYKQYGSAPLPYREAGPARPTTAYGRAKHQSESLIRAATDARISAVFLRLGPISAPDSTPGVSCRD